VGIAIGGGAEVAEATAPVALLNGGLRKVPVAIDISRECMALIRLIWTIISVPNTVALGLALDGGWGWSGHRGE
jgi:cation transport ATPase